MCRYDYGTYIPITGGDGWPWLGLAYKAQAGTQYVQLCFNTSGPNEEQGVAGGVIGVGFEEFNPYTGSWADAAVWCLPDYGTTANAWCTTGASVYNPVPAVEVVDEPGSNDVLLKVTWNFRICSTPGCTSVGDTLDKTGAIVGLVELAPTGPGGATGATLKLLRTEVWVDGQRVGSQDNQDVAGVGVTNTQAPTVNNTVTPAGSPCLVNGLICLGTPTGTLSVNGYSTTANLMVAGTTVPVTVSTDLLTSGGKTCLYTSGTSC